MHFLFSSINIFIILFKNFLFLLFFLETFSSWTSASSRNYFLFLFLFFCFVIGCLGRDSFFSKTVPFFSEISVFFLQCDPVVLFLSWRMAASLEPQARRTSERVWCPMGTQWPQVTSQSRAQMYFLPSKTPRNLDFSSKKVEQKREEEKQTVSVCDNHDFIRMQTKKT